MPTFTKQVPIKTLLQAAKSPNVSHSSTNPSLRVAFGFTSLDLSWQHVGAITFADEIHYDSFKLHFKASADTDAHGILNKDPDSDTILRYG